MALLNQFQEAVNGGTAPETSAEDNVWTLAMVDASIVSHRERRVVTMDEVFTPDRRRQAGLLAG